MTQPNRINKKSKNRIDNSFLNMAILGSILGNLATIVFGHHSECLIAFDIVLKYSSRKVTFMKDVGVLCPREFPFLIVCH